MQRSTITKLCNPIAQKSVKNMLPMKTRDGIMRSLLENILRNCCMGPTRNTVEPASNMLAIVYTKAKRRLLIRIDGRYIRDRSRQKTPSRRHSVNPHSLCVRVRLKSAHVGKYAEIQLP